MAVAVGVFRKKSEVVGMVLGVIIETLIFFSIDFVLFGFGFAVFDFGTFVDFSICARNRGGSYCCEKNFRYEVSILDDKKWAATHAMNKNKPPKNMKRTTKLNTKGQTCLRRS